MVSLSRKAIPSHHAESKTNECPSTERDSHPVGTTVKVTQFFENIPVRKHSATKNAAKCLAKLRRLMQAYALARPFVRFRLHILKAKNNKGDFIYAPKSRSNVEDAVLKVISKDCALQCDWTALESDGFEIHAFLPKSTANGPKIANHGAFISIDSRPVSNSRGTIKQVVTAFKERLRKSNPYLTNVKEPFFCMNIICPPDSYDPNIEPAKDDVMFDDGTVVLNVVDKLLRSYYPQAVVDMDLEPPTSTQRYIEPAIEEASSVIDPTYGEPPADFDDEPVPILGQSEPRWRSSMYGIDEDDLEHLQGDQPLVTEEEEGLRAADVSNPWTIARMNATIKPKAPITDGQLLSPAKSYGGISTQPNSPVPVRIPLRQPLPELLTPQTSSKTDESTLLSINEHEESVQLLPQSILDEDHLISAHDSLSGRLHDCPQSDLPSSELMDRAQSPASVQTRSTRDRPYPVQVASALGKRQRKVAPHYENSLASAAEGSDDTWFGQPMRGTQSSQPSRRQKRRQGQGPALFPTSIPSIPRRSILSAADGGGSRLYSEDNTDIRDFFGHNGRGHTNDTDGLPIVSSFTPINLPALMSNNTPSPSRLDKARQRPSSQPMSSRATSFEPSSCPQYDKDELRMHIHGEPGPQPRKTSNQFEIYEDSPMPPQRPRPFSAGSERPSLVPVRSNAVRTALDYFNQKYAHKSRDMAACFEAYQDCENASPDRSSSPIRRQERRNAPAHELASITRPPRRRTTDGTQWTKSSNLPLERVPHGCHIQDIVLIVHLNIASMIQSSRKIYMSLNSLEYNYPAEDAFDTFAGPVSEQKIIEWVIKLDATLHEQYEQIPGADVRSLLHEAIQRGLDDRKEEDTIETVEFVEEPDVLSRKIAVENGFRDLEHGYQVIEVSDHPEKEEDVVNECTPDEPIAVQTQSLASPEAEDEMSDFDMSQFVHFDVTTLDEDVGTPGSAKQTVERSEEEFGEDIEDDMLLDL